MPGKSLRIAYQRAGVAELADAQDLGSCGVTPVEVQVLSPAPLLFRLTKKLEQTPYGQNSRRARCPREPHFIVT
jgi:hypothetical protein